MKKILLLLLLIVLSLGIIGMKACETWEGGPYGYSHGTNYPFSKTRPECQATWTGDTLPILKDTAMTGYVVTEAGLSVPGPITDIPEFHDCQKFVASDGATFGSLNAVFAAPTLAAHPGVDLAPALTWSVVPDPPASATISATGLVTFTAAGHITVKARTPSGREALIEFFISASPAPDPPMDTIQITSTTHTPPPVSIGHSRQLIATVGDPTTSTTAVAQIYSYGDGYGPLGMGPNFSCLYVFFDANSTLVAKMVKVTAGTDMTSVTSCVTGRDPATVSGTPLTVRRTAGLNATDFPPVARWDFDPVNQKYYIGIACGTGWCEVGAPGPGGSSITTSTALTNVLTTSGGQLRVTRIKGWYDQQQLAMSDAAGNPVPSGIIGTVIPHPDLATFEKEHYEEVPEPNKPWLLTGYVLLDTSRARPGATRQYAQKYNFVHNDGAVYLDKVNRIYQCYGTRSHCGNPPRTEGSICSRDYVINLGFIRLFPIKRQWVKLVSASGGDPHYKCGIRRSHVGAGVPEGLIAPTSRWRWLANDDTVWEFCAALGCCEVERDT